MRFKLTLEYAGTRYRGWQIQRNARTVAGELFQAIEAATGHPPQELYGSGRTDAGVHALAQVAHLDLDGHWPPDTLLRRINEHLPFDINVLHVAPVRHRFHARHDAVARSYVYQIARRRSAFAKPYVWWVREDLDVERMRALTHRFVGMHDFRSFADDDASEKSTTVKIEGFDVYEDGDLLLVHIEGSHFLWKMVRRLVGVLAEVGRGGLGVSDAAGMLTAPSALPATLTAPAAGLFLERVYYEGDPRNVPVQAAVLLPSWARGASLPSREGSTG